MNQFTTLIFLKVVGLAFAFAGIDADEEQTDYDKGRRIRQMLGESVLIDTVDYPRDYPHFGESQVDNLSKDLSKVITDSWHRQHHKHGRRKQDSRAKHRNKLLRKMLKNINKNGLHLEPVSTSIYVEKKELYPKEEEMNRSDSQFIGSREQEYNMELFTFDHRMWIGIGLGTIGSILTSIIAIFVYNFVKQRRKKQYCVDLSNLSLCSLGEIKPKEPVYVRLSELHDPRAARLKGQYVVSVMNQSNNFSICTDSSSEEELFDRSDARMRSPKKSMSKISMTSTPIKGSPAIGAGLNNSMHRTGSFPVVASPQASPVIRTETMENVD